MKTRINIMLAVALAFFAACSHGPPAKPADINYYTCTMHTSVHAEAPGKCPICGMELVPVMKKTDGEMQSMSGMQGMPGMEGGQAKEAGEKSGEFVVPVARQQQIGVTYATVERRP